MVYIVCRCDVKQNDYKYKSLKLIYNNITKQIERDDRMFYKDIVWVIMSKDRKAIACGVPRNRKLKPVDDIGNNRILTYSSQGKAEAGFRDNWFYNSMEYKPEDMEAVPCLLTMSEVELER